MPKHTLRNNSKEQAKNWKQYPVESCYSYRSPISNDYIYRCHVQSKCVPRINPSMSRAHKEVAALSARNFGARIPLSLQRSWQWMISNNCIIMTGSNVAKEWVRMLTRLRVRDGERNGRPRLGLSETRASYR